VLLQGSFLDIHIEIVSWSSWMKKVMMLVESIIFFFLIRNKLVLSCMFLLVSLCYKIIEKGNWEILLFIYKN